MTDTDATQEQASEGSVKGHTETLSVGVAPEDGAGTVETRSVGEPADETPRHPVRPRPPRSRRR